MASGGNFRALMRMKGGVATELYRYAVAPGYVDDVLEVDYTDASPLLWGKVGFYAAGVGLGGVSDVGAEFKAFTVERGVPSSDDLVMGTLYNARVFAHNSQGYGPEGRAVSPEKPQV